MHTDRVSHVSAMVGLLGGWAAGASDAADAAGGCPANLILQDAIERIYVGQEYGDIERGIYLIRGENVVLLGEVVR